jgi:2-oxoglutarate ferredoxin oxidoreductase subunit beta
MLASGAGYVARETVAAPWKLVDVIKGAFQHDGFAFVEAMTTCTTYYGRMNKLLTAADMIKELKEGSVKGTADDLFSKPLPAGKFYVGKFTS